MEANKRFKSYNHSNYSYKALKYFTLKTSFMDLNSGV